MSIRVSALTDNPLQETMAVNRIRASSSQGSIITIAVVANNYSFAACIATLGSDSVVPVLGLRTFTLVTIVGDNTCVFSSIKQKKTHVDVMRSGGS